MRHGDTIRERPIIKHTSGERLAGYARIDAGYPRADTALDERQDSGDGFRAYAARRHTSPNASRGVYPQVFLEGYKISMPVHLVRPVVLWRGHQVQIGRTETFKKARRRLT